MGLLQARSAFLRVRGRPARICLHGYWQDSDYRGEEFDSCLSLRAYDPDSYKAVGSLVFYPPRRPVFMGEFNRDSPEYFGYEYARDTLNLSTTWIKAGAARPIFLPGFLPMDSVELICRRAIARDPVSKDWSAADFARTASWVGVTRMVWKLAPGGTPIVRTGMTSGLRARAIRRVDAAGRKMEPRRGSDPGALRFP